MTQEEAKRLIEIVNRIVERKMQDYALTEEKIKPTVFEEKYMKTYTHGMFIDHILFRKHLRELDAYSVQFAERLEDLDNIDKKEGTLYVITDKGQEGLYKWDAEKEEFVEVVTDNYYTKDEMDAILATLPQPVVPETTKEVVPVDTYDTLATLTQEQRLEGVLYLTQDDNKLYAYDTATDTFNLVSAADTHTIYTDDLDSIPAMELESGKYTVVHLLPEHEESVAAGDVYFDSEPTNVVKAVKFIRELFGYGLKEAKNIVDKIMADGVYPAVIKSGVSKAEWETLRNSAAEINVRYKEFESNIVRDTRTYTLSVNKSTDPTVIDTFVLSDHSGYAVWGATPTDTGAMAFGWHWQYYAYESSINTLYAELDGKEDKTNKVTQITADSTDEQYPTAKCLYDIVQNMPRPTDPTDNKDVVVVVTYDDLTAFEEPSSDWLYLVSDTNTLYSYDGMEFKPIHADGIIYIVGQTMEQALEKLDDKTTAGSSPVTSIVQRVTMPKPGRPAQTLYDRNGWTLEVRVNKKSTITEYTQTLRNGDGYYYRTGTMAKGDEQVTWSDWTSKLYAYKSDVDAITALKGFRLEARLQWDGTGKSDKILQFKHPDLTNLAEYEPRLVLMRYRRKVRKKDKNGNKTYRKGWTVDTKFHKWVDAVEYRAAQAGTAPDWNDETLNSYYRHEYQTNWEDYEEAGAPLDLTRINEYYSFDRFDWLKMVTAIKNIYYNFTSDKFVGGGDDTQSATWGFAIRINNPYRTADERSVPYLFSSIYKIRVHCNGGDKNQATMGFNLIG